MCIAVGSELSGADVCGLCYLLPQPRVGSTSSSSTCTAELLLLLLLLLLPLLLLV